MKHKYNKINKIAIDTKKLLRYGIVGISNALITSLIYIVLYKWVKLRYLLAFTISWIAGVLYTYTVNYVWVFKPEARLKYQSRLLKYAIVYVASYSINIILLTAIVEYVHTDPVLAQVAIVPLIVIVNYSLINRWALKPRKEDKADDTN